MTDFSTPQLPSLGIIAELEDDDRRLLSNYGEFLPAEAQQNIITEGDAQDSLYFIISGLLHVHSLKDNKRTLLGRIEPGETFGEVNVFDPGVASANVTAQKFSQIWKANGEDLKSFAKAYPEVGIRLFTGLLAEMSKRIRATNEKLSAAELNAVVQSMWH
jgi:CRP-like cAMP-binding protein